MKRKTTPVLTDSNEEKQVSQEEQEEEDEQSPPVVKKARRLVDLHHQQQQGAKEVSVLAKASALRAQGRLTDLVFLTTRDGQRHPAHRVVLATVLPATSRLLTLAVESTTTSSASSSEPAVVEVSCSGRIMEAILDFIYEGRLVMSAQPGSSSSTPLEADKKTTMMKERRIEVRAEEVWEVVHEADAFGVPGLAQRVRDEMERELLEAGTCAQKAVAYLDCLHSQEQRQAEARDLLQFVLDLMAHHFEHFSHHFYFNVLPFPLFRRIIHHPELAVRKEIVVWEVVRKYCATVLPSPSPAEIADLVSAVRFGYMTAEELRSAELSGLVSDELIKEGFFHSLRRKESPSKWRRHVKQVMTALPDHGPTNPLPLSSVRSLPRPKPGKKSIKQAGLPACGGEGEEKVFRYRNKDFGQDGIVWWLATNRGKKNAEYQNPFDAQVIGLTPSTHHGGYQLSSVFGGYVAANATGRVARRQGDFFTDSAANSWLIFDFGRKHPRLRIRPTHITIKSTSGGTWSLCNFDFQASHSGSATGKWKTLLSVKADMSLQSGGSKTWRVTMKKKKKASDDEDDDDEDESEDEDEDEEEEEEEENGYRYFRIQCTGPDTGGDQYLALSGFEVYGKVTLLD